MSKDEYLVVGANGFIGSHMVDKLSSRGLSIKAFDRYSVEPQFVHKPSVKLIQGDIYNDNDLRSALSGVKCVLHSFSATTPFISENNPYIDITDNLFRSVKLFDMCANAGVKKVGFISSGGAVYGNLTNRGIADETDAPTPISPYGINKLSIEYYLEYFRRKFGMDYVVYRLTNPYGPRQLTKNNQGVVPTFINNIKEGKEITVYGDGTSSRDYIYIDDAVTMIAESLCNTNKFSIYNVGRGEQISLNEIIHELQDIFGHVFEVKYQQAPSTFLEHTGVNINRFISEYGPIKFTPLHEGLISTVASASSS